MFYGTNRNHHVYGSFIIGNFHSFEVSIDLTTSTRDRSRSVLTYATEALLHAAARGILIMLAVH